VNLFVSFLFLLKTNHTAHANLTIKFYFSYFFYLSLTFFYFLYTRSRLRKAVDEAAAAAYQKKRDPRDAYVVHRNMMLMLFVRR
jgi:hypothetical protein